MDWDLHLQVAWVEVTKTGVGGSVNPGFTLFNPGYLMNRH